MYIGGPLFASAAIIVSQLCPLVAAASYGRSLATSQRNLGYEIPITTMVKKSNARMSERRGEVSGSMGLGDNADLVYSIPVEIGDQVYSCHLDTGSSDLWVISDQCLPGSCGSTLVSARYPTGNLNAWPGSGPELSVTYGDSTTETSANGTVTWNTTAIAGIAIEDQAFGVVTSTDNAVVKYGLSGILGLGFPVASHVQEAMTTVKRGSSPSSDKFLLSTFDDGPLMARIAMTDALQMPMFSVSLQRNTIDVSGRGLLTLGKPPDDVKESDFTWVPVRLYTHSDGGIRSPAYASKEIFPYRWEIDIDDVFLDGEQVPKSTIQASGVDSDRVSAFMDTGNSILRGPEDLVNNILSKVSSTYNPDDQIPLAELPCNVSHTLSFQIGGKLFPIDPRDFISQASRGNSLACKADNLVATDPPSKGALFRWSLGVPFFKSNIVAFHYGNLTHPSVDPPRIGILSVVPANATQLLQAAVARAASNGGNLPNTVDLTPTKSAATMPKTTVTLTIPQPFQALKDMASSATSLHSISRTSSYTHRLSILTIFVTTLSLRF